MTGQMSWRGRVHALLAGAASATLAFTGLVLTPGEVHALFAGANGEIAFGGTGGNG
ncbi:MAG: hypothetical protein ACYDGN_01785 [Acidimicrobiales bacterium]